MATVDAARRQRVKNTIKSLCRIFADTGNVEDKLRSGRKRKKEEKSPILSKQPWRSFERYYIKKLRI